VRLSPARPVLSLPLCLLLLAGPLGAQVSLPPDSATLQRATEAGVYLLHWVQKVNSSEHSIYFKNTAQFAIQVVDWEVYDCVNIRDKDCGPHTNGPLIQPAQSIRLATVRQRERRSAYSYLYRFHVTWEVPLDSSSMLPADSQ
jgi:hypothetical protein